MIDIVDEQWKTARAAPPLDAGAIDLWRLAPDREPPEIGALFELLSNDERARADKFVFARDRSHFIACRATLRKILGGYLGADPRKIEFSTRRYGKPFLTGPDGALRFNVSHSHSLAVVAVTLNREIGVDIEYINRDFDVLSVAPSAFSPADFSQLSLLATDERAARFFAGWTRKEAFLKAVGDGLSGSEQLQSAVSWLSDKDVVDCANDSAATAHWSLTSFVVREDFKASLAVEGKIETIRFWSLAEEPAL